MTMIKLPIYDLCKNNKVVWLCVAFIGCTYLLSAQAMMPASKPKQLSAEQDFLVEFLDMESVAAFEKMALQKVQDFANYLSIIGDDSYDNAFRNHATKLAINLFENEKVQIQQPELSQSKTTQPLTTFLKKLKNSRFNKIEVAINLINFRSPLMKQEGNYYAGTIAYQQKTTFHKGKKTEVKHEPIEVAFTLRKEKKQFGKQIEYIWTVKLGEMRVSE